MNTFFVPALVLLYGAGFATVRWSRSRRSALIGAALGLTTAGLALIVPSEPLVRYGFGVLGLLLAIIGSVSAARRPSALADRR